jgi:hypothetical protein
MNWRQAKMFRIVRVAANFLLQMVEDSFKLSWKMCFSFWNGGGFGA